MSEAFYICDDCKNKVYAVEGVPVPDCPCQTGLPVLAPKPPKIEVLPKVDISKVLNTKATSFTVPGQPVPKGRPRLSKRKAFTPQKTKDYQQVVALVARQHIRKLYHSPLFMHLKFYREIQRGKKPDVDNLAKSVMDALEGIAYKNDDLIRKLYIEVEYIRGNPRCEVFIAPISDTQAINERLAA